MKRLSLGTLATFGVFILACAGGSDEGGGGGEEGGDGEYYEYEVGADDLPSVTLSEPWNSMKLPINDGNVVVSDKVTLLVAYDSASISSLTSSYSAAIEKAGWSKSEDYSSPDFTAIIYTKGSQSVGFASGVESGITFAYMEDLDGVPDSAVKAAKSGKKGLPSSNKKVLGGASTKKSTGGGGTPTKKTPKKGGKKGGKKKAGKGKKKNK
jgi:hypothetical protein